MERWMDCPECGYALVGVTRVSLDPWGREFKLWRVEFPVLAVGSFALFSALLDMLGPQFGVPSSLSNRFLSVTQELLLSIVLLGAGLSGLVWAKLRLPRRDKFQCKRCGGYWQKDV